MYHLTLNEKSKDIQKKTRYGSIEHVWMNWILLMRLIINVLDLVPSFTSLGS